MEIQVKLSVNITLGSNYYNHTKEELESLAYEIVSDYIMIRKDEQYSKGQEDFDMENGFYISDYEVDILK